MSIACLNGCGRIQGKTRGVCPNCDAKQRKAIRKGLVTDAELVAAGKRAPVKSKHNFWHGGRADESS